MPQSTGAGSLFFSDVLSSGNGVVTLPFRLVNTPGSFCSKRRFRRLGTPSFVPQVSADIFVESGGFKLRPVTKFRYLRFSNARDLDAYSMSVSLVLLFTGCIRDSLKVFCLHSMLHWYNNFLIANNR